MSKGGGKSQKVKVEPYAPTQPYITGQQVKGQPNVDTGLLPEALDLYKRSTPTQEMGQALSAAQGAAGLSTEAANNLKNMIGGQNEFMSAYGNFLKSKAADPFLNQDLTTGAQNILKGQYNPNLEQVSNVSARDVNMTRAREAQGALDPTQALAQLLTGQVNNQYLDPQAQAITNIMSRNLAENVMPGIRSGSLGAGQYGGTRQGIAEGLAASRLNQDLAPALTNLYGTAFENAQNRMMGVGQDINRQAQDVMTGNVDRNLQAQMFNANLGLQRNQQEMAKQQQIMNQLGQGLNMYGQVQNLQAAPYQQFGQGQAQNLQAAQLGLQGAGQNLQNQIANLGLSQAPLDFDWKNLQRYADILGMFGGMGSQESKGASKNVGAGVLGGAMGGAQIGSAFGPFGTALGAIGGGILGAF